MPSAAKRRRVVQEDESSEEEPTQSTQRRRPTVVSDAEENDEEEGEDGIEGNEVEDGTENHDQLAKKLVRYALACEYQRMPIRRTGISEKVIGKKRGAFKKTFESAQKHLRLKFGMEMVELPIKEKITMKDRRAAQKTKGGSKAPPSYILVSTLPIKYRSPDIMPPSLVGDEAEEAAYVGLCTFVVSVIALSPEGAISDAKLERFLERVEANQNMPMGKRDEVVARMIRQSYIFKTVDKTENDENIEWRVGPRGKVEIGNNGVQGLVKEVYGDNAPEDLDQRLQRSLGIEASILQDEDEDDEEEDNIDRAGH